MFKSLLILCSVCTTISGIGTAQMAVHVEPAILLGSRPLQEQTSTGAIRDYLQSWQSLKAALEQNRVNLLDPSFVGLARDKLARTIEAQAALGIHTSYQDRAHDLQIVFYSPEGLSMELIDKVEYEIQVFDHDKIQTTQRVSARYVVVLTPAEVRWRVRVFQVELE